MEGKGEGTEGLGDSTDGSSSNSSPAGRTARSACQRAERRSWPKLLSAPISASAVVSSRRRPATRTSSSIVLKRRGDSMVHWCEQTLQKYCRDPGTGGRELKTCWSCSRRRSSGSRQASDSIIEGSSQPHLGHEDAAELVAELGAGRPAMARPACSRRPLT